MDIHKKQCPLCTKKSSDRMGRLASHMFCRNCKLGWIKKIPRAVYDDTYYTSGSSLLSKVFSPIARSFFRIREYYAGLSRKKIYIDVGAGEGNYLQTVRADTRIGVEISAAGRKRMREKGLHVLSNEAFLKVKKLDANVISFWHVLEHVADPLVYIKAAERNLLPSGKMIIAVPNINSLEFRLFGKYWFHLAPRHHLWFFSPASLQKMLKHYGLQIDSIDYWAIEHHLTGLLQSCINATTHTDNILHKLIRRKQGLFSVTLSQMMWILFWCTVGLPFVVLFWSINALSHRSGAIVLVVSKKRK